MQKLPPTPRIDQKELTLKFCRVFFLVLVALGSLLYFSIGHTIAGGFGLSTALFALVSFFHFSKLRHRKSSHSDTRQTWFFFSILVIGILLILCNKYYEGPHFYYGIAGGMCMLGGIAYALELLLTWLDSVR